MTGRRIWSRRLLDPCGRVLRRMPLMITCRAFEDFVLSYFEGDLPPRQKFVLRLHLMACRECRDYLAAYRRTVDVAKRAFDDGDAPVPADVPEDLVKAILAARDA